MRKSLFARWRASFFTGLVIVLPGVITLAIVKWLFGTISSFTDALLFFLKWFIPPQDVFVSGVSGEMFWYWSVLARYYIGKRLIEWVDGIMLRVPVLNKIYGTIKQVDAAFAGNKNSFKTVVLVEYPREGLFSVGFITSETQDEVSSKTGHKTVCVFIPTTPIPTSGFLVIAPVEKVTKLDMSVAEGFKYIISLGALTQESALKLK